MKRALPCPASLCAVLAALALVVLSFGLAAPASAVTPGVDRGNSEAAHEKNADRKSDSADAATTSVTAAQSGDAAATERSSNGAKQSSSAAAHQTDGTRGTSGEPTKEQPVSKADQSSGGANGQCSDAEPDAGPYCSTRDGSPSGNGQGVGKAQGKPCAGCVGKADNKNPPGQMPGPQDRNNGYECDNNNGIGKGKVGSKDGATSAGNPAHTGCATPPTVTEDCPPSHPHFENDCVPPKPECEPTPANDFCGEGESECVPTPGNDFCEEDEATPPGADGGPPPTIAGEQELGAPRPPTVAGVQQLVGPSAAAPESGVLPATGAAWMTGALTTLGIGLLLMGGALLGVRRRSMAPTER